ncbi:MAG: ABC transporter permease [Eubacteriales bacterium]|nr:ABC transporter permease [Eubacteriales bacterium]
MKTNLKFGNVGKIFMQQKAIIAIVVLFVAMTIINKNFLSINNMASLLMQVSVLLIMTLGVTFCIISGECDLSLGSQMCVAGILSIILQRYLPLPAILLVVLLVGVVIGIINAVIIVDQGANSFIVTLGMMMALKGVALVISNGTPVAGKSTAYSNFGSGSFLHIYYITWIAIALLIVCAWVLRNTQFGRNCFAIGGGTKNIAAYTGINVQRHRRIIFIISALSAALAGFCLSAELNSGSATYGETTALLVNCGCVVGGTPFNGGYGGIIQSTIGILLFGLLDNSMSMQNISSYYQQLIKGIVIVVVVALDCYARKKKRETV